jgi:hypothetical protein
MRPINLRTTHLLYLAALGLALLIRLPGLGSAPLSDYEARHALQALGVAGGGTGVLDTPPAYTLLTAVLIFFFGDASAVTRLGPALIGSGLALLPYFFRRRLGEPAALVLAFCLALDPGLTALSRQANPAILGLAFSLAGLAGLVNGRLRWAGMFGGLALLSGAGVLFGLLGFGLAVGVDRLLPGRAEWQWPGQTEEAPAEAAPEPAGWRQAGLAAAAALLLAGSLFGRAPQGLGAFAAGLPELFTGWLQPSGVPAGRILAALAAYQLLAILFGAMGAVRAWRESSRGMRLLGLWAALSLVLLLLYPARQLELAAWGLVPLWALAAWELSRYAQKPAGGMLVTGLQALLIFTLLALTWINLAGMSGAQADANTALVRWLLVGGILSLGVLASLLIGLGWSAAAARQGSAWGICLALGFVMLAAGWGSAPLRSLGLRPAAAEAWMRLPAAGEADRLTETLGDLAEWRTGRRDSLDIVLVRPSPSLEWAVRRMVNVTRAERLGTSGLPSAVIAPLDEPEPALAIAYRGQAFDWQVNPEWTGSLPQDWIGWLIFRKAPVSSEQVILWVRSDVFPGGEVVSPHSQPVPALDEPADDLPLP